MHTETIEGISNKLALVFPPNVPTSASCETTDPDVLQDSHVRKQAKVLVNKRQSEPVCLGRWERQIDRLAADFQRCAGVRDVIAGQDLDQGRLPRAVATNEPVDLTPGDFEADVIEGPRWSEGLGQTLDTQRRDGQLMSVGGAALDDGLCHVRLRDPRGCGIPSAGRCRTSSSGLPSTCRHR